MSMSSPSGDRLGRKIQEFWHLSGPPAAERVFFYMAKDARLGVRKPQRLAYLVELQGLYAQRQGGVSTLVSQASHTETTKT